MFVPFQRTLRANEGDTVVRPFVYALVALVLLAAWWTWFARARVPFYVSSDHARVEVSGVGNGVEAAVAGSLVSTHIALGRRVAKGEILAQLDSSIIEQRLAEARGRHNAVGPGIAARQKEIEAETLLEHHRNEHMRETIGAARADLAEVHAQSTLAAEEARRSSDLYKLRTISEMDNLRDLSQAKQKAAHTRSARWAIARLKRERDALDSESAVRITRLRAEIVDLQSTEASTAAAAQALAHELENCTIRAPVSGQIAETAAKQVGAFVHAGDRLATIVPDEDLRAVAEFDPAVAVGRIRSGQQARIRLDGFPWMQYGSVPATVTHVGTEVRNGTVRAEFAIHADPSSAIPLQHGLSGNIEVEVERVTPSRFVLRLAGQILSRTPHGQDVARQPR
jgi:membrane fusion protein (multidrug efflux system)